MSNNNLELPLIIYQNTYFTDSLISIIEDGLNNNEKKKISKQNKKSISSDIKAESKSPLGLIPFAGYAGLKGDSGFADLLNTEQDIKITDSYKFSKIKEYITQNNITCTLIENDKNFDTLKLGQFVEFTSSFKKNNIREISDLLLNEDFLDLLLSQPNLNSNNRFFIGYTEFTEFTNDLTEDPSTKELTKITNRRGKQKLVKSDPIKTSLIEQIYQVIERLKKDFPDDATSLDFYGQIKNSNIKNCLICDTKFFVQEDKNRILDGQFKIFGKVIDIQKDTNGSDESYESTFTQFDRNKFFKRTTKQGIKELEKWLKNAIDNLKSDEKQWFNSDLNFIIEGKAIKVLPIVIYI